MLDSGLLSKVKTLTTAERLELLAVVWQTLSPADAPVTEAEQQLLDTRLTDLDERPTEQSPWSEVNTRLQRQLP